jgi:phosphatidylinositol glycan class M
MFCQTFAFVTFNKVCTSQYFLWYLVFLPLYLPNSTLLNKKGLGSFALLAWLAGQAAWLWQGYKLEFLGQQTFVPGLWYAGLGFFAINCWILGVVVADIATRPLASVSPEKKQR